MSRSILRRYGIALCLLALACGDAVEPGHGGTLELQIVGLEPGTSADVRVTGPGGFARAVTHSTVLSGLESGSYSISAASVARAGTPYVPSNADQTGDVIPGSVARITVQYSSATATSFGEFNLWIDGLHLTQATQRYDGSVPLVAGRDAFLRVFGLSNRPARSRPVVLVQLFHGQLPVFAQTLRLKVDSLPTVVSQGQLATTWNVVIPGRFIVPGLGVLARIDPGEVIPETSEADNVFPADGLPRAVTVRPVPVFRIRFVPIRQQANDLLGGITTATAEQFLGDVKVLLPVSGYEYDVRAPYSTSAPPLQADNANDAWGMVLSELNALKRADRESRYYYGVVKTPYRDGVGGIGYVGGGSRVAVGWDRLPSASYVMAHEIAHNMGRTHAPCGVSVAADPAFPYANGRIGAWGFDPVWLTVKNPTIWADLTGYCNPYWVSDYSWESMLAYRQTGASNSAPPSHRPGLLVWGRITRGKAVLEPAFQVEQGAALPAPGPHRIEGLAADGSVLFSIPFAAERVADLPTGPEEAFALVLPVTEQLDRLAELRLIPAGRPAVQRKGSRGSGLPAFSVRQTGDGGGITWDASRHPMLLVRDRLTGEVISFARGGALHLPGPPRSLELSFSDGIRSQQLRR